MSTLSTNKCLPRRISVLAAVGVLAGLAFTVASLASDMDANAKALAKLDDDWSKAAATRDADKVALFHADDAIAYPPNEPIATGRAAAKKVWASYFADPTFTIAWKTTHAEASKGGDLGLTAGTYEASYKGLDGKPVTEKGKYVCTWKKQSDGSWKAAHDIWNTDTK